MTVSTAESVTPASANSLPLGRMLMYGSDQTGVQIIRDTPALLLPVFMSTMQGISPWLAGLAILVPKLWLVLCDPLVDSWSDRRKAAWGRTPFLLVGAPLTALGFGLLFWLKPLGSVGETALAMAVLYTLMATAYSVYPVPYLALAAELSPDPHQRTTLLAWRIVFTMVGVVAGAGFAQPLIGWAGGGSRGWEAMGLVFAGISGLAMLCPLPLPLPVPVPVPRSVCAAGAVPAAMPFLQQMRKAWDNRPF